MSETSPPLDHSPKKDDIITSRAADANQRLLLDSQQGSDLVADLNLEPSNLGGSRDRQHFNPTFQEGTFGHVGNEGLLQSKQTERWAAKERELPAHQQVQPSMSAHQIADRVSSVNPHAAPPAGGADSVKRDHAPGDNQQSVKAPGDQMQQFAPTVGKGDNSAVKQSPGAQESAALSQIHPTARQSLIEQPGRELSGRHPGGGEGDVQLGRDSRIEHGMQAPAGTVPERRTAQSSKAYDDSVRQGAASQSGVDARVISGSGRSGESGPSTGFASNGHEGDARSAVRGESRGDTRGDIRSDTRGESRGDTRGDIRGDTRGELSGGAHGGMRGERPSDPLDKVRTDTRGELRGESSDGKGVVRGGRGDIRSDALGEVRGDTTGSAGTRVGKSGGAFGTGTGAQGGAAGGGSDGILIATDRTGKLAGTKPGTFKDGSAVGGGPNIGTGRRPQGELIPELGDAKNKADALSGKKRSDDASGTQTDKSGGISSIIKESFSIRGDLPPILLPGVRADRTTKMEPAGGKSHDVGGIKGATTSGKGGDVPGVLGLPGLISAIRRATDVRVPGGRDLTAQTGGKHDAHGARRGEQEGGRRGEQEGAGRGEQGARRGEPHGAGRSEPQGTGRRDSASELRQPHNAGRRDPRGDKPEGDRGGTLGLAGKITLIDLGIIHVLRTFGDRVRRPDVTPQADTKIPGEKTRGVKIDRANFKMEFTLPDNVKLIRRLDSSSKFFMVLPFSETGAGKIRVNVSSRVFEESPSGRKGYSGRGPETKVFEPGERGVGTKSGADARVPSDQAPAATGRGMPGSTTDQAPAATGRGVPGSTTDKVPGAQQTPGSPTDRPPVAPAMPGADKVTSARSPQPSEKLGDPVKVHELGQGVRYIGKGADDKQAREGTGRRSDVPLVDVDEGEAYEPTEVIDPEDVLPTVVLDAGATILASGSAAYGPQELAKDAPEEAVAEPGSSLGFWANGRYQYVTQPGDTVEMLAMRILKDARLAPLVFYKAREFVLPEKVYGVHEFVPGSLIELPLPSEIAEYKRKKGLT